MSTEILSCSCLMQSKINLSTQTPKNRDAILGMFSVRSIAHIQFSEHLTAKSILKSNIAGNMCTRPPAESAFPVNCPSWAECVSKEYLKESTLNSRIGCKSRSKCTCTQSETQAERRPPRPGLCFRPLAGRRGCP